MKPAFVYPRCSGERLSYYSFSTIALYFYWCFNFQLSINEILNTSVFPAATPYPFPWSGNGLGIFYFSLLHFYRCFNSRCFSTTYRNTFNISYGFEASICLFPNRGENCKFIHFHFGVVLLLFQLAVVVLTIKHDNLHISFDSEASTSLFPGLRGMLYIYFHSCYCSFIVVLTIRCCFDQLWHPIYYNNF